MGEPKLKNIPGFKDEGGDGSNQMAESVIINIVSNGFVVDWLMDDNTTGTEVYKDKATLISELDKFLPEINGSVNNGKSQIVNISKTKLVRAWTKALKQYNIENKSLASMEEVLMDSKIFTKMCENLNIL